MTLKTKVKIVNAIAFFITFLMIWMLLHILFENLESAYKGMISAALAVLLTPRINNYKTQSGNQIQLIWVFLKKTIKI